MSADINNNSFPIQILGLKDALNNPTAPVSTVYSPEHCQKCWCCVQNFSGGLAVFTFPRKAAKCSGAAQKIMYLAHDYWRKVLRIRKIYLVINPT